VTLKYAIEPACWCWCVVLSMCLTACVMCIQVIEKLERNRIWQITVCRLIRIRLLSRMLGISVLQFFNMIISWVLTPIINHKCMFWSLDCYPACYMCYVESITLLFECTVNVYVIILKKHVYYSQWWLVLGLSKTYIILF